MTLGLEQYENRNKDDPVRLDKHKEAARTALDYSGSTKISVFSLESDMDQTGCEQPKRAISLVPVYEHVLSNLIPIRNCIDSGRARPDLIPTNDQE